ncbi:uncharacterized protein A1O5_06272 [Cladophialophora psammophila CBS 110553]|uniref:3-oxoacyl-[acyl-carrier protein] reductase n=1 Tax=Cladophialophora psammophila CBS 110553 TaxID=1182543 RepID=W9XIL5_9EURO|nr:uncharacterized protein A1O5_06272 [Cladophialophora psammophila CBS 110553]EXJ70204.1 hypothetical protein A1O5_06272 [Cladophialophora psammophila CBS 110553]
MSVAGRVAIVTGAGRGLGRLYALVLAERGAKVLVNDYGGDLEDRPGTIAVAQAVVDEIVAKGGIAVAHSGDVSKDYKDVVDTAVREFGTVHILINNAGITGKISPHDNVDPSAFMRDLETSVLGTAMLTSAVYSIMAEQKYGRIVNTSSNAMYGLGSAGDCAYGAAKAAAFAMTRQLGRWSERDGIKINCTMPSAASRMGDISEGTKLSVLWRSFSTGADRAAREAMATFPGLKAKTPEQFLQNWDKVMGKGDQPFLAASTLEQVQYVIR